jgi:hypothetical protein
VNIRLGDVERDHEQQMMAVVKLMSAREAAEASLEVG